MSIKSLLVCLLTVLLLTSASAETRRVEVFVTSWCPYCQLLEQHLKSNHIPYLRQDIEKNETAKRIHKQLGGGGVPVVRIDGSTIIRGFDPGAIDGALKGPQQKMGAVSFSE